MHLVFLFVLTAWCSLVDAQNTFSVNLYGDSICNNIYDTLTGVSGQCQQNAQGAASVTCTASGWSVQLMDGIACGSGVQCTISGSTNGCTVCPSNTNFAVKVTCANASHTNQLCAPGYGVLPPSQYGSNPNNLPVVIYPTYRCRMCDYTQYSDGTMPCKTCPQYLYYSQKYSNVYRTYPTFTQGSLTGAACHYPSVATYNADVAVGFLTPILFITFIVYFIARAGGSRTQAKEGYLPAFVLLFYDFMMPVFHIPVALMLMNEWPSSVDQNMNVTLNSTMVALGTAYLVIESIYMVVNFVNLGLLFASRRNLLIVHLLGFVHASFVFAVLVTVFVIGFPTQIPQINANTGQTTGSFGVNPSLIVNEIYISALAFTVLQFLLFLFQSSFHLHGCRVSLFSKSFHPYQDRRESLAEVPVGLALSARPSTSAPAITATSTSTTETTTSTAEGANTSMDPNATASPEGMAHTATVIDDQYGYGAGMKI